jgi:hypothetical protein
MKKWTNQLVLAVMFTCVLCFDMEEAIWIVSSENPRYHQTLSLSVHVEFQHNFSFIACYGHFSFFSTSDLKGAFSLPITTFRGAWSLEQTSP